METKTDAVFNVVNVLFWVIFIGLCIKTGALLLSFIVSLFFEPQGARDIYLGLDLYELLRFNKLHYAFIGTLVIAVTALKANLAYQVTRIFARLDLRKPFSVPVAEGINRLSQTALLAGIIAIISSGYGKWVAKQDMSLHPVYNYLEGGSEFLFLAGIIYVLAAVFKKGVEIQSDSELTI